MLTSDRQTINTIKGDGGHVMSVHIEEVVDELGRRQRPQELATVWTKSFVDFTDQRMHGRKTFLPQSCGMAGTRSLKFYP